MSGKQKADPIPADTYAGFAASAPGPAAREGSDLRLSGEARTYARDELRRRSARRRRAPVVATAVLAVLVVGGVVAAGLMYEPDNRPAAPAPSQTAPAPAAESALPPLPEDVGPTAPPQTVAPAASPAPPASQTAEPESVAPPAAPTASPREPEAAAAPRAAVARTAPPAPKPAAQPAAAAKWRSSAQAAADRAATERVAAAAALDQEVNKAYAEALNAGASRSALAEAQENWIIRRDRVRREDPEMAEDLARARIAELRAIAARGGGEPPAQDDQNR